MIRHIVLFSARDPHDLGRIRDGLALLKAVPHARLLEVAPNLKRDSVSNEIDVVVYAEFDRAEDLDAFKAHPAYAEATRVVRPLREVRIVADIDADVPDHRGRGA